MALCPEPVPEAEPLLRSSALPSLPVENAFRRASVSWNIWAQLFLNTLQETASLPLQCIFKDQLRASLCFPQKTKHLDFYDFLFFLTIQQIQMKCHRR